MNDLFLILSDADICSFADDITLFVFLSKYEKPYKKIRKK